MQDVAPSFMTSQPEEVPVGEQEKGRIRKMADFKFQLDEGVSEAEARLKELKETRRKLVEETIPQALAEMGYKTMELDDGAVVSVKQEVYCSIPKKYEVEALNWLHENGYGDLVSRDFECKFKKGEDEDSSKLAEFCSENDLSFTMKEKVHPQTLKAQLKKWIEEGKPVPLEWFGARPVTVADVKLPKK